MKDLTAGRALAIAGRSGRTFHAHGCRVDGGTQVHGRRRFHCPRCAELNADTERDLLIRLDRIAQRTGL